MKYVWNEEVSNKKSVYDCEFVNLSVFEKTNLFLCINSFPHGKQDNNLNHGFPALNTSMVVQSAENVTAFSFVLQKIILRLNTPLKTKSSQANSTQIFREGYGLLVNKGVLV